MINSVRGKHSSPGIYFKETELTYSAKSLGITTLGVAGETLKGPAFEPITISDWSEFQYYFGGTSTKKFKDSQYPKYELPFIAKSYLTESKQLEVVRVLGLSGYNAGPAWLVTADDEIDSGKTYVVAVIRSKGHYEKYFTGYQFDSCTGSPQYDYLVYDAKCVTIDCYKDLNWNYGCYDASASTECTEESYNVSPNNLGKFVLNVTKNDAEETEVRYAVSLNYGSKDYIYDVLGSDNESGSSPLFVEEVYDVALTQLIESGRIKKLNSKLLLMDKVINKPICDPVLDFLTIPNADLRRSNIEQTYIFDETRFESTGATAYTFSAGEAEAHELENGHVYQVRYSNALGFHYVPYTIKGEDDVEKEVVLESATTEAASTASCTTANSDEVLERDAIYINAYGRFFEMTRSGRIMPVTIDMNNYKERFRPAVTPWFVSQVLGNGDTYDIKRLFRFTTISDGNTANKQVKISIEKIRPEDGTFNVVIRDYNDSDLQQNVLERFNNCSMDPAASTYIGKKIGTTNGDYIIKSKYVSVEVTEDDTTKNLVPCGNLGYPIRVFGETPDGKKLEMAPFKYNTEYFNDIRVRKQYFGMSDIIGVDLDMLNYKGVAAYNTVELPENGFTNGFHLDTRANLSESGLEPEQYMVTVDQMTGYTFDTVTPNASVGAPVIGTEEEMYNTIFEDINTRKFTVFCYGGYDGWDIYRGARTTGDEFKFNKYKGNWSFGEGTNFTKNFDTTGLALDGINAISSDYYAFLAGYRQFANPEAVDINLFATPGIDLFNNILLTEEAMNIIEDDDDGRKGDALYVITTPDKPFGASDAEDDMYTADDIVDILEDTNVDSSYAATYFPWVKYFDADSGTYINLPPTKDVMRNFAFTDNTAAPWFASAGINRGPVNCVKAHKFTKQTEEDTLYDGRVNVIKTFASDGVKVWGNKTLSTTEGPLNRINVRRLMIRVKKLITQAARQLIFEQNDATLRKQFQSLVEPILANVRANRGITDYRLDIQQSIECEDEHELSATIWIKPTPTLEYISINFNITAQCVTFDE